MLHPKQLFRIVIYYLLGYDTVILKCRYWSRAVVTKLWPAKVFHPADEDFLSGPRSSF